MIDGGKDATKVWDLPIRLFHWLLVTTVLVSWRTAEAGAMEWHYISGIIAVGLILFRILWGLFGSSTARFSRFLHPPSEVFRYLRQPELANRSAGHNPLGGYSVIVMLALLGIQVITGLFAVDLDGLESGPLSYLVTFEQGRLAAEIHETTFNFLGLLIALHIAAILYYRVRHGRKLTSAMITGNDPDIPPGSSGLEPVSTYRFVLFAILSVVIAIWVQRGLFI